MANTEELHEHPSTRYARHFDIWLKDFKETGSYADLVNGHDGHWIKIYRELDQIFKDTVWKLRNEAPTEETSSDEDEEVIPMLKIDASQRDNYKRQFRAWMAEIKDTCPNREIYFGRSYGIDEHVRYERFFFKHHWDPEKTVDESLMKALLGSEWDKHYDFDYNAM